MAAVQDLFTHAKATIETVAREETEKTTITQLATKANSGLSVFVQNGVNECDFLKWCTRRVEKAITMILRAYIEQGPIQGIELARYCTETAKRELQDITCMDDQCFNRAIVTFQSLEELMANTQIIMKTRTGISVSDRSLSGSEDIDEEGILGMVTPLSNIIRLKIMKDLAEKGKNYTVLERQLGIKGGHLQFHLNKLISAGYIYKEKKYNKYSLTLKGLKVLRSLQELSEELSVIY